MVGPSFNGKDFWVSSPCKSSYDVILICVSTCLRVVLMDYFTVIAYNPSAHQTLRAATFEAVTVRPGANGSTGFRQEIREDYSVGLGPLKGIQSSKLPLIASGDLCLDSLRSNFGPLHRGSFTLSKSLGPSDSVRAVRRILQATKLG